MEKNLGAGEGAPTSAIHVHLKLSCPFQDKYPIIAQDDFKLRMIKKYKLI